MDVQSEVSHFLVNYKFPTNINGYFYLKQGIAFILENKGVPSNKLLFTHLAEKFNTSVDNIERCIRTIVDKMWEPLSQMGMFGHRPTTREFILTCSEYVCHDFSRPSAYDIFVR